MNQQTAPYLPRRTLSLNVGFLLDGQLQTKDMEIDLPAVRVTDNLVFEYVCGSLRLSHTREGILLQGEMSVGVVGECYRCLKHIERPIEVSLQELYATSKDISDTDAEFHIREDGKLDLAPLLRAEVLIQTTRGLRCEDVENCDRRMQALEQEAGIDHIDPRLAKLQQLLDEQTS